MTTINVKAATRRKWRTERPRDSCYRSSTLESWGLMLGIRFTLRMSGRVRQGLAGSGRAITSLNEPRCTAASSKHDGTGTGATTRRADPLLCCCSEGHEELLFVVVVLQILLEKSECRIDYLEARGSRAGFPGVVIAWTAGGGCHHEQ